MRTLSLKIVERFPSELRALVAGQDRLTRPGVTAESDMAFDADLEELTSLIESAFGADDLDEQKVLDAIEEAVSIQRLRDERAARGAAGELRAEVLLPGGIDAESRPTLYWLRARAQKADDAFTSALVAEYGKARAGDARYWHDGRHPLAVRQLAAAKVEADREVQTAIEEGVR